MTTRSGRLVKASLLLAVAVAVAAAVLVLWRGHLAGLERAEGLRAARAGRFAEAEPLLRRALERSPDDLDAVRTLTLGLLGAERPDDAEPYLDRWCALRPDDAEPFKRRMDLRHRRARAALSAGEGHPLLERALADGRRAVELDPDDDGAAQEVVWLLLQLGQFDEADRLCRHCLRRQPHNAWVAYLLARIGHARGAAAEARALLDAVLGQSPDFADGLLLRAEMHDEAGEPDKAVPLLRRVLALGREHEREARYRLSLALARTGQAEEAKRVMAEVRVGNLDKLLTAGTPDTPAAKVQRAEERLAAGRDEEAVALLTSALAADPGFAPAHRLLASYHERKGEPGRAAGHRRRAGP